MICNKCGAENEPGARFCASCGSPIETIQAEQQNPIYESNYPQSNASAENIPQPPIEEATVGVSFAGDQQQIYSADIAPAQPKAKKSKFKIALLIIIPILLIAGAAAALFFTGVIGGQKEAEAPLAYTTESGELYIVTKLGNEEAEKFRVTKNIGTDEWQFSENYKYIVYGERASNDEDDYSFNIYCKEVAKKDEAEPILIAKNASFISAVIGEIDYIIYTKDDNIYAATLENSEKIATDAYFSGIAIDSKKILVSHDNDDGSDDSDTGEYIPSTNSLYIIDIESGEKTTISEKASRFDHNDDLSIIAFIEKDTLYKCDINGEKEKIADNISNASVGKSCIYYLTEDKTYKLYDLVDDKYAKSDEGLEYPDWYEDYEPDSSKYATSEEYWDAYDKASEQYDKDYDAYYEASDRIYLREELQEYDEYCLHSLYVYSNGKSEKLSDKVADDYINILNDLESDNYYGSETDYATVNIFTKSPEDIKKPELSDYKEESEIREEITSQISTVNAAVTPSAIIEADTSGLKLEKNDKYQSFPKVDIHLKGSDFIFGVGCTFNYVYTDDYDYDVSNIKLPYDTTSIYTLSTGAKDFSSAKLIAENVYSGIYNGDELIALDKYDNDNSTYTANIGDTEIEKAGIIRFDNEGNIYYFKDVDKDKYIGTLYKYSNGDSEKIADDIYLYSLAVKDGKILALTNYSDKYYGDLTCFTSDGKYQIDEKVSYFVSTMNYPIELFKTYYDDGY